MSPGKHACDQCAKHPGKARFVRRPRFSAASGHKRTSPDFSNNYYIIYQIMFQQLIQRKNPAVAHTSKNVVKSLKELTRVMVLHFPLFQL
jgi:hypothetical protein